jgi:hypothetical protein
MLLLLDNKRMELFNYYLKKAFWFLPGEQNYEYRISFANLLVEALTNGERSTVKPIAYVQDYRAGILFFIFNELF